MPRIRSVKPSFFRHEQLQALAVAKGLHLMLVFEGLWGHCDNKGRFEWRPNQLKLDILPFVPYDMAGSLAILGEAGFIVKYVAAGKEYGWVPTFLDHQRITGKERTEGEKYPAPPEKRQGRKRAASGKHPGHAGDEPDVQELGKGKGMDPPIPPPGFEGVDLASQIEEEVEEVFQAYPKIRRGKDAKNKAVRIPADARDHIRVFLFRTPAYPLLEAVKLLDASNEYPPDMQDFLAKPWDIEALRVAARGKGKKQDKTYNPDRVNAEAEEQSKREWDALPAEERARRESMMPGKSA